MNRCWFHLLVLAAGWLVKLEYWKDLVGVQCKLAYTNQLIYLSIWINGMDESISIEIHIYISISLCWLAPKGARR